MAFGEKSRKIAEQERDAKILRSEIEKLNSENLAFKKEIAVLQTNTKELQAEVKELQAEIDSLQEDVMEVCKENAGFEARAKKYKDKWKHRKNSRKNVINNPWHYTIKPLITDNEQNFFPFISEKITQRGYLLFSKVRWADFLDLTDKIREEHIKDAATKLILPKHVDFLVCKKDNKNPVLIIEIDDASHDTPEMQERDGFLNRICEEICKSRKSNEDELKVLRLRNRASELKGRTLENYIQEEIDNIL